MLYKQVAKFVWLSYFFLAVEVGFVCLNCAG